MFLRFFILALVSLGSLCARGQISEFRNKVEGGYNFLLYTPGYEPADSSERLPIILFLHGRSLSGNNLARVRRYGVLEALELRKIKLNAWVLAPQLPSGEFWNPEKVKNVLQFVYDSIAYDTNRLYVVGMSLGGYGTLDFAGTYPEMVAAAIAMCGGGKEHYAGNLATLPLWLMHGKSDRAVPYSESQKIVDAINATGNNRLLRYDFYDYMGHGELGHTFYSQDMYAWLFQYRKDAPPDSVHTNFSFPPSYFKLKPPPPKRQTTTTPDADVHIVRKGDTLYAISRRYNTTIEKLCNVNGLSETSILQIGQEIKLK